MYDFSKHHGKHIPESFDTKISEGRRIETYNPYLEKIQVTQKRTPATVKTPTDKLLHEEQLGNPEVQG